MNCPECKKETKRLEGIGMDDYLNDMQRCSGCNDKKYPERVKQREEFEKNKLYNSLIDAFRQ